MLFSAFFIALSAKIDELKEPEAIEHIGDVFFAQLFDFLDGFGRLNERQKFEFVVGQADIMVEWGTISAHDETDGCEGLGLDDALLVLADLVEDDLRQGDEFARTHADERGKRRGNAIEDFETAMLKARKKVANACFNLFSAEARRIFFEIEGFKGLRERATIRADMVENGFAVILDFGRFVEVSFDVGNDALGKRFEPKGARRLDEKHVGAVFFGHGNRHARAREQGFAKQTDKPKGLKSGAFVKGERRNLVRRRRGRARMRFGIWRGERRRCEVRRVGKCASKGGERRTLDLRRQKCGLERR